MSILASASRDAHERERAVPSEPMSTRRSILVPDQLPARRDGETRSTRLLVVPPDAIGCFRTHLLDPSRRGRRLYGEAETWLLAQDAWTPLGFETVRDALDLDAGYVRGRLFEWRRRELARAHPAGKRRAS